MHAPHRRFLIILTLLALLSRLIWVLWLHPGQEYIFSDMAAYVRRAVDLAEKGWQPGTRHLAWQAWGTHVLLAIPLKIFGTKNLQAASICWGLMSAATVPIAYLLACRVCSKAWMATAIGILSLLWYPHLSSSGYFLSETPFLLFMVASTWRLVVVAQEGRGGLGAGILSAITFALRPQSALFFVFLFIAWLIWWRKTSRANIRQIMLISTPLLLMLAFSLWRFHVHTGYWGGIAEAANANLTVGRCHNPRMQAFRSQQALHRSRGLSDGRYIGVIALGAVGRQLPASHPLALRPALGPKDKSYELSIERNGVSEVIPVRVAAKGQGIKFVGYIGDRDIHRALVRMCVQKTGFWEQLRYSIVNVSGLWFFHHSWPDSARRQEWFLAISDAFVWIFNLLVLVPSWIGMLLTFKRIAKAPGLAFCALQLLSLLLISAIFFGEIRLRTPFDIFALILALEAWDWLVQVVARIKIKRPRARK